MTMLSIGDLAQSLQLRRDNARLSARLATLTQELSTGQTASPDTRLRGDYTVRAALTTDLSRNAALDRAYNDFALETDARQSTLGTILDLGRDVSTVLLQVSNSAGPEARVAAAQTAASRLDGVLDNLNTRIGGRSLFAGVSVDGPAVATSNVILDAIETEISLAGASTPEDIETVIQTWFAPGGGFETIGFLGAIDPLQGPVGDGSFEDPVPTAFDLRLRDTMSGLVMAAIVDRGVVPPSSEGAVDMLNRASVTLLNADQNVVSMRAEIGITEQRTADGLAELSASRFALEEALAKVTEVDSFEVAVALEATETQLRTLYSLTAKLSSLSLTEFLR